MELAIHVDRNRAEPLHQQVYQELRRSILDGRLGAGSRIPSSRTLAKSLGVSRATVTLSYEQLLSEGYLQATIGSGTSVSPKLPDDLLHAPAINGVGPGSVKKRAKSKLSSYGENVSTFAGPADEKPFLFDFRYCRPAVDHFPIRPWRRLLMRHCRYGQNDVLDYAPNGKGYAPLRQAIAGYLRRSRAVNCTADQIVIVNGSQQALQIAAQVLVNRGDAVAVEDPGYLGAKHAFSTHGADYAAYLSIRMGFSSMHCQGGRSDCCM
jgi:GntR family transcriptional regulator/MocR family aminotransferase